MHFIVLAAFNGHGNLAESDSMYALIFNPPTESNNVGSRKFPLEFA
jgi:hypothetical protein